MFTSCIAALLAPRNIMFWLLLALSIFVYTNIGYAFTWFTTKLVLSRARRKKENCDTEIIFTVSWKTFFLFPYTTLLHSEDLRNLWEPEGEDVVLEEDCHPRAFVLIKGSHGAQMGYKYLATILWPLKVIWPIFITSLALIFLFALIIFDSFVEIGWKIITFPIRLLLKEKKN